MPISWIIKQSTVAQSYSSTPNTCFLLNVFLIFKPFHRVILPLL